MKIIFKEYGYSPKMNPKGIKYFLLFFALLAIFPILQDLFHPFKLVGLDGAFTTQEKPVFTLENFRNGKYQETADIYLKDNAPFRADLVRLRNQIDYFAFGNINTILTLGKENYIFDPNYILAREGKDYLPDSILDIHAKELVAGLQVLNQLKVPVLFCFAPNKANFYSEYLPVSSPANPKNNQSFFDSLLRKNQVQVLDAGHWLGTLKNKSPYPLLPKYGAHWSIYGASLVGDSLLKSLSKMKGKSYPRLNQIGIETGTKARFTDDDYLASLNLIWKWKSPEMAYPRLSYSQGERPNILVVSDSYFWSFYDLELVQNCFAPSSLMWYYNRSVYDMNRIKVSDRDTIITPEDIKHRDAILIVATGPSLKDFAYGFFHQLSKLKMHEK